MSSEDIKNKHSVLDHQYGADTYHTHDGEADHDHDHDFAGDDPSQESLWRQDNVILHSVGIDVGSSGTQVVFSRIHLRRIAEDLSSRYTVVERTALYQSPISLTPYLNDSLMDAKALGAIIDKAYQDSGLHPDEIDARTANRLPLSWPSKAASLCAPLRAITWKPCWPFTARALPNAPMMKNIAF